MKNRTILADKKTKPTKELNYKNTITEKLINKTTDLSKLADYRKYLISEKSSLESKISRLKQNGVTDIKSIVRLYNICNALLGVVKVQYNKVLQDNRCHVFPNDAETQSELNDQIKRVIAQKIKKNSKTINIETILLTEFMIMLDGVIPNDQISEIYQKSLANAEERFDQMIGHKKIENVETIENKVDALVNEISEKIGEISKLEFSSLQPKN